METAESPFSDKKGFKGAQHVNDLVSRSDVTQKNTPDVCLVPQLTTVINYALQQNRLPILPQITIQNHREQPLDSVTLTVDSAPEILVPYSQKIEQIPAQAEYTLQGLDVKANPVFLTPLTERIQGTITIHLSDTSGVLAEYTSEATALAYDEWHGTAFFPELITAFITPNHPEISKLVTRASTFLQQWTGDPSLDAYQRQNPNRVRMQAAAIYAALQEQNIVYSVPPASFEVIGQRVRLCDTVMQQKMGTCLDLTLLYASAMEAIGLHPLLVLLPGHIFAGVWLEEQTFSEAVLDDVSQLTKRLADGIGEIAVIESTCMTAGKSITFDEACAAAVKELQTPVDYIIDVSRARLSGIRPLPQRIQKEDGWHVETPLRQESQITNAPQKMDDAVQVQLDPATAPKGKIALWERKLLDLGLRNPLINLRLTQRVVPILADSLAKLEDALADGEEYVIGSRPAEWGVQEAYRHDPEQYSNLGPYKALIHSEFENHRLRSPMGEGELTKAVTNLYRTARTSLEENGANTLYLSLGLLRWYETKTSERARYAPIILLPVDIIRKSARVGYVIRLRDEEPQMNITLLEMLKQDFSMSIGGLDPLPQDDHGIDLRKIYATMRRAVMEQSRWDVIETAFLGIFSFFQFVMWNDLHSRAEELKRNKIVSSLVEGRLQWNPEPLLPDQKVDEKGVLLPIPADASQLYATEHAASGESFVLHGPPGTGKSQTITALVANALAQGKTVLFVAEKMAALSVVESRLKKIGIGPFCLELHSNKSKKRDVLDQLKEASEVTHGQPRESWQKQAEQAAALRSELDKYAHALHQTNTCGYSLFDLVCQYEDHRDAPSPFQLSVDYASGITREQLQSQKKLLGQLVAAREEAGDPQTSPLRLVGRKEYTPSLRGDLAAALSAYLVDAEAFSVAGEPFIRTLGQPSPVTVQDWAHLAHLADLVSDWLSLPTPWTKSTAPDVLFTKLEQYARHASLQKQTITLLSSRWQDSFLQQDARALKDAWTQVSLKWFLPRMLGQNRIIKLLSGYAKGTVVRESIAADLDALMQYQSESQCVESLKAELGSSVSSLSPEQALPETLNVLVTKARALQTELTALLTPRITATLALQPDLAHTAQVLQLAHAKERSSWTALAALMLPRKEQLEHLTSAEIQDLCRQASAHLEELRDWCVWNQACEQAELAGMTPLVVSLREGLPAGQADNVWQKAISQALILSIVESNPVLSGFSGTVFNETIRQFKELDAHLTDLAKTEIYCRLAAQVPNFTQAAATGSEVGILQRAIRSGGRGISIRRLFEGIPTLLPKLCPCMLMSPLSVAQYLDPHQPPFDLVVFDEASQLPTCKAVGVLARGENAVIVGDPKQMPPTSFFASSSTDEENLEEEDLESILDDCLALNMPQSHLLWHYRSRHESLIAFSNREFYDNQLYTFPSSNDRQRMVQLIPVSGWFDRGGTRQNRAEAQAIVAELSRRAHDPVQANYSVGVVTFNIQQQNLISDLLDEACKSDEVLETWAFNGSEPLFIKNLENVQGDERDVILFSIGYGPDAHGKVTMNFGPLNREGGWRRLNVAVSRARRQMIVFSTLMSEQINLSRTSARGVAALKDFLDYASSGNLRETAATSGNGQRVNGIARDICSALEENGWRTLCSVGHSKYRLDVAVMDPAHPEQYLLGILLDGDSYRDARTTRDREIAQTAVLEGLGWNLHRIWTMDWLENRDKELTRLLALLQKLKDQPGSQPQAPSPAAVPATISAKPDIVPTVPDNIYDEAPIYQAVQLPVYPVDANLFTEPQYRQRVVAAINKVLEQEAPIRESLLIRRVSQAFGFARAGSRIQAYLVSLLSTMRLPVTEQNGERFYWSKSQDPNSYSRYRVAGTGDSKRDIRDLPCQEIANAAAAVLRSQVGLPADDLIRETARLLGYARIGTSVKPSVEAGLHYGIQKGLFQLPRPQYYTLSKD